MRLVTNFTQSYRLQAYENAVVQKHNIIEVWVIVKKSSPKTAGCLLTNGRPIVSKLSADKRPTVVVDRFSGSYSRLLKIENTNIYFISVHQMSVMPIETEISSKGLVMKATRLWIVD